MRKYDVNDLPPRLFHSMNLSEDAIRSPYERVAVPLIVCSLELLVNTGDEKVSKQFVERVPKLASEVGFTVSKREANRIYDLRGTALHSTEALFDPAPPQVEPVPNLSRYASVAKVQDIVRAVQRRAIEDDDFRAAFVDEHTVRARWPVVTADGRIL